MVCFVLSTHLPVGCVKFLADSQFSGHTVLESVIVGRDVRECLLYEDPKRYQVIHQLPEL